MKKIITLAAVSALVFLSATSQSYADGSTGNITISKTVLSPKTNTYVKNLGISDGLYHPGDTIVFHITLANTGGQTAQQIIVRDTFPQYVNFVSGVGSFDSKNKILSFLVYNLKPNTTQSYAVTTKVVSIDQFSSNQRNLCLTNKASIISGQNQVAQDTAQFCITVAPQTTQPATQITSQPSVTSVQPYVSPTTTAQQTTKGGQPIYPPAQTTTTPSTGVESYVLPTLIALAGAGSFLKRKATKMILGY